MCGIFVIRANFYRGYMKRLLGLLLLFFSVDAVSMSRVFEPSRRIASRNTQLSFNTPRNFGTTHFIAGYKNPQNSVVEGAEKKQVFFDDRPPIIGASSAHLLDKARQTQSFFTTIHDISSIILTIISESKENIDVEAFSLTDKRITDALIAAHKRGVRVRVIMDAGNMKQPYSKAQRLIDNGIAVCSYNPQLRPNYKKKSAYEPLMHHKCIVADGVVITGSANATRAAQRDNIENITILRDPQTVQEHRQEFERLKTYCDECKPVRMVGNKIVAAE